MDELKRLQTALGRSRIAVYEWDLASDTISWSGNIYETLGLKHSIRNAMKIASRGGFLSLIHKDDATKFLTSLEQTTANGGHYERSYRISIAEDKDTQISDIGVLTEEDGRKILVGTILPVETGKKPQLKEISSVTVKNSSSNQEKVKALYSPRRQYHSSEFAEKLGQIFRHSDIKHDNVLLKISIDNLPMMMKWHNVEFAEKIMNALGKDLGSLIRKNDVIKRIEFDQFGIILLDQSESEMELVIDNLLRKIQLYRNPEFEEPVHIRTSIGSVRFPSFASNTEDALDKAFLAMTSARGKSSEFYCDYADAKKEHLDTREQMRDIHTLQNALDESKMKLAYQPIIEAKSGGISKYECLLRIADDDGGVKSAGMFIPTAERMGMIDIIDQFVLEQVVEVLGQSEDIALSFNVSNMTTDNPKWLKMCSRLLQDNDVANRIIVEVTETAAQRDMRQTAYFVAALQALGCKVALDDFGAGYTSFRQLKSLSVDMVKIDGSYVRNLVESSDDQIFVRTLIDFAHSYGLETIAECVETGDTAKILMDSGIDYMQGYYFGKPDIKEPWS